MKTLVKLALAIFALGIALSLLPILLAMTSLGQTVLNALSSF